MFASQRVRLFEDVHFGLFAGLEKRDEVEDKVELRVANGK